MEAQLRALIDIEPLVARGISSARIVPTCVDANVELVALGASSGSLYLFDRRTLAPVELYSHPAVRAAVSCVRLSPDGRLVAFGCRGQFIIAHVSAHAARERCVWAAPASGTQLLSLAWAPDSTTVYHGYHSGEVVVTAPRASVRTMGRASLATELVARSADPVVQLSVSSDGKRLLISTTVKTSLYDIALSAARAVGKQAARAGPYGAVYHPHLPGFFLAARPGHRLWLVQDETASVVKTLPLAHSLQAVPDTPIASQLRRTGTRTSSDGLFVLDDDDTEVSGDDSDSSSSTAAAQLHMFGKLAPLGSSALVAWGESGLYLLDLQLVAVVHAYRDACVLSCAPVDEGNEVFVVLSNGACGLLCPTARLINRLCELGLAEEALRVWASSADRAVLGAGQAALSAMLGCAVDGNIRAALADALGAAQNVFCTMELEAVEVAVEPPAAVAAAEGPELAAEAPAAIETAKMMGSKKKRRGRKSARGAATTTTTTTTAPAHPATAPPLRKIITDGVGLPSIPEDQEAAAEVTPRDSGASKDAPAHATRSSSAPEAHEEPTRAASAPEHAASVGIRRLHTSALTSMADLRSRFTSAMVSMASLPLAVHDAPASSETAPAVPATQPPPPQPGRDDAWVSEALEQATLACGRACDSWRGLQLRRFASSESVALIMRACGSTQLGQNALILAARVCVAAEWGAEADAGLDVEQYLRVHGEALFRSDRAVEACAAACAALGVPECTELLAAWERTASVSEQRRSALTASTQAATLADAMSPLCSSAVVGTLLLWRLPALFALLDVGRAVSAANERLAVECASRWPALQEDAVRAALHASRTPAADAWRLSYELHLCRLHPHLWCDARMTELLLLAAATRPPSADVACMDRTDQLRPCAGALGVGLWPLDSVMFELCTRAQGRLVPTCRRIGYWRGIADLAVIEPAVRLRVCLAAGDEERSLAILQQWCGQSAAVWAHGLGVVQDTMRELGADEVCVVTPLRVYQLMIQCVRPLSDALPLLQSCDDVSIAPLLAHTHEALVRRHRLAVAVLECVDAHLWAKRNPALLPQATAIAVAEQSGDDTLDAFTRREEGDGHRTLSFVYGTTAAPLSFDETAFHWGAHVAVHGALCPVCLVALTESTPPNQVRAFRCGHAVHSGCCPEEACVVCFSQRFRSLTDLTATTLPLHQYTGV